jgi:hypothetical protein
MKCGIPNHVIRENYLQNSVSDINTKQLLFNGDGPSDRAVWGEGLDGLDVETVGSNTA